MKLRWSNQRAMANSKLVKSSAIWLIVVPFFAKGLASLDNVIELTIFNGTFKVSTVLPFSWQLLFFSACFFTLAGIIYSIYCPNIVKLYENFSQFEADGKSRLQINSALREVVWDTPKGEMSKVYAPAAIKYFKQYTGFSEDHIYNNIETSSQLFENLEKNAGKNSNAFYFVYSLADFHNLKQIKISLTLYVLGYACIGVIAIQNVFYVIKTFF